MSFAPVPRRPSHLGPASAVQRPPFNPRSSSLSVTSQDHDSTASLLASARRPNGSGLKRSATVPDPADPLAVLESLLAAEADGLAQPDARDDAAGGEAYVAEWEGELDLEGQGLRQWVSPRSPDAMERLYTPQTAEECRSPALGSDGIRTR